MKKTIHFLWLILPLILMGVSSAVLAQPAKTLPIGVTVDIPDGQEATPGQFVTYTFDLSNTNDHPTTLTISARSDDGWSILGPEQETEIVIDPHSSTSIPITLAVPTNAAGNQMERLTLEIRQGAQRWRVFVDTHISAVHKIAVDGGTRNESEPGKAADYPITIINQGSLTENITLSAVSENAWSVRVEPEQLLLQPGEKIVVHVFHSPPASASVGSGDKVVLTATSSESNETVNLTLLTQVVESRTPQPVESRIPLRTTWLWEFTSPTQYIEDPELRWIYSVNGTLQPDYSFDFYMNGNYDSKELIAPDAIHLALNMPNTLVNIGRVDPSWSGVLPLPTQTALLSVDHDIQDRLHLQILTGTERDDDNFFHDQVQWMAWSAWVPDSPWTFRVLLPKKSLDDADYLGELDYALKFGTSQNSWSLRARIGGGESDSSGFKRANDLFLSGYGDKWNFRGEYVCKDGFFDDNDESHLSLNGVYRFNPDFSWELGLYQWDENERTDPADLTLSSDSIWTRFNLWKNLSLTLSTIDENQGTDSYRQPKVEIRYYYLKLPITCNFTVQWMQPDYQIAPDETKWTFDGQYKYAWSDLHYIDNRIHYYIAQALDGTDESWSYAYRLNYSHPINNSWSFEASTDWDRSKDSSSAYENTSTTVKGEFLYKPDPETQWRFSVYDVLSSTDSADEDTLTFYLLYQRQFLSFIRSPWAGVEGIIYEDLNGNGRLDPEDPLLQGLNLVLDSRKTVQTDIKGHWAYAMLPAGSHHLSLDLKGQPYYTDSSQFDLTLKRGITERIYIPVRRKNFLHGMVFIDVDRDQTFTNDEKPLSGVRITLLANGQKLSETQTNADGSYFFNDILPGTYQLQIDPTTLPGGSSVILPIADQTVEVAKTGIGSEVNWALAPKEKEIEFTFDNTGSEKGPQSVAPLPEEPNN